MELLAPASRVFRITGTLAAGENALTWVVTESGTPLASRLARIGAEDTDDAVLGIKQTVAGALSKTHRQISGIIRPTTTTVSGDFNGFTKDIAYLLPAAPTAANRSWVAILHGFADLSTGTPGTNPTAGFSGDCRILRADEQCLVGGFLGNCTHASATWQERTCASAFGAGWQKIDTVTVCPPAGQASFRSTPVGTLSYGVTEQLNAIPSGQCFTSCNGSHPCSTQQGAPSWQTDHFRQDIRINDQTVSQPICLTRYDTNGSVNQYGQSQCHYWKPEQAWANSTVIASNPRHILCCIAN